MLGEQSRTTVSKKISDSYPAGGFLLQVTELEIREITREVMFDLPVEWQKIKMSSRIFIVENM